MRIAFFGGTFDPIHRGHLAIASAAADTFALDRVLFAPAARQPLKPEGTATPYPDRLAMVALACEGDARFVASSIDAPRADGAANYTVDTIAALRDAMPQAQLFVLVGADSFLQLRRWHQPDRLLASAEWIVVSRPGFSLEDLSELLLGDAKVHLLNSVHEDVSATELRSRLERGDVCGDLLPGVVCDYIQGHKLYCE